MILPPLNGTCDQTGFFIYAACDSNYFNDFGQAFINSIQQTNSHAGIHIHLFNPTEGQVDYCKNKGVSVTWESAPLELFETASQRWSVEPVREPDKSRYDRTLNAMGKGGDRHILDRMQKTYYACARFIRMAEIYNGQPMLAIDIDAVVRKPLASLGTASDLFMHRITGRKARYLAGGFMINPTANSTKFVTEYAEQLKTWFSQDYIYWGLDQDLLDPIAPKYMPGQLPMTYIDWNMSPGSFIWTAKGTRKELDVFVNEQKKYKF